MKASTGIPLAPVFLKDEDAERETPKMDTQKHREETSWLTLNTRKKERKTERERKEERSKPGRQREREANQEEREKANQEEKGKDK